MYNIASEVKKHRLYIDFQKVKARLARHQFVCWIAGGAVRDFCLGKVVNEFDLVTDATTDVLKALFPEAILIGESFGVLKIPLVNNEFFDLTTFRQESDYADGRRPSHVVSSTPLKDSERRDFTINALFWDDVQGNVIDFTGGSFDLLSKKLVCVGEAEVRFSEDYLRILRLARFSAVLGFAIESKTEKAALNNKSRIQNISGERIWSEFSKICKQGAWNNALKLELFRQLLNEIFGENLSFDNIESISDMGLAIYLLKPKQDFTDILKKKLKISNKELLSYAMIRQLKSWSESISKEELAYELECKPEYQERLQIMRDSGLINHELKTEVDQILASNRASLIEAKDLVGMIPSNQISSELRFLRIAQFNAKYKTKDEMIDYLKKKYASQSQST